MKLALVGVGNAGCRIVNRIVEFERQSKRTFSNGNVLLVNSRHTEFHRSVRVAKDRRYILGETDDAVDDETGVNGDVELAASVARAEIHDLRREFDVIEMLDLDGILVVAGLGGGTGAGAGAVLLEELQEMYEKPIYALGVLPGSDEDDLRALNAARALRSFVPTADNVLLLDNDTWHDPEDPDDEHFAETNGELARRIGMLLGAGELKNVIRAENAVDVSDMIRTLETGGVSSIGFASTAVPGRGGGLLAWIRRFFSRNGGDGTTDAVKVNQTVRRAVRSQLTLPCDVSSAERALVVLSGPPSVLSRQGFETARHWLEQEADTVEVLAGDEPQKKSSTLSAVVVLSNVTDAPRIKEIQDRAVAFRREHAEELKKQNESTSFEFGKVS